MTDIQPPPSSAPADRMTTVDQFAKAVDNAVGMAIVYGQANPAAIQARQALLAEYRKLEKQRDHWRRESSDHQETAALLRRELDALSSAALRADRLGISDSGAMSVEGVVVDRQEGHFSWSATVSIPVPWPIGTRVRVTRPEAATAPSSSVSAALTPDAPDD